MTPYWSDDWLTVYQGDCREVMASMEPESVHCVVTSPPYWGLRDYGTATWVGGDEGCDHVPPFTPRSERRKSDAALSGGLTNVDASDRGTKAYRSECGKCGAQRIDAQLGLEPTPEEYVANMVGVFREVRRVLRDDGTVWLNLGSSYMASGERQTGRNDNGRPEKGRGWAEYDITRTRLAGAGAFGRSPSHQPVRAPAYGSDGTERSGSPDPGSAYHGLCDGCLADYLTHRGRTPGSLQPLASGEPSAATTDRGIAPPGFAEASLDVSPRDAQESTSLRSWLRRRGPCSRCDSRAASLSAVPTSVDDAPASSRIPWLNYTATLKPKDMVPIPWMVAMALQADGWYLRSEIIWSKPNPMPESVTDRPTKAHEYLFLLSKSARYYFDADAVREPHLPESIEHRERYPQRAYKETSAKGEVARRFQGANGHDNHPAGRNIRSVWTIATQPYPGAHFATFPPKLVEPCVKAGCPQQGVVLDPFGGSGTTGMVAQHLGRRAVLIDLNGDYLVQAMTRNAQAPLGLGTDAA